MTKDQERRLPVYAQEVLRDLRHSVKVLKAALADAESETLTRDDLELKGPRPAALHRNPDDYCRDVEVPLRTDRVMFGVFEVRLGKDGRLEVRANAGGCIHTRQTGAVNTAELEVVEW